MGEYPALRGGGVFPPALYATPPCKGGGFCKAKDGGFCMRLNLFKYLLSIALTTTPKLQ